MVRGAGGGAAASVGGEGDGLCGLTGPGGHQGGHCEIPSGGAEAGSHQSRSAAARLERDGQVGPDKEGHGESAGHQPIARTYEAADSMATHAGVAVGMGHSRGERQNAVGRRLPVFLRLPEGRRGPGPRAGRVRCRCPPHLDGRGGGRTRWQGEGPGLHQTVQD